MTPDSTVVVKSELRLSCRDEKALELILQYIERKGDKDNAPVYHAMLKYLAVSSEQNCCRTYQNDPEHRDDDSADRRSVNKERKLFLGFLGLVFTHSFRDNGASARAEHKSYRAEYHQKRHDEVDRRELRLSHEV